MAQKEIHFGVIGCGLMGREFASAAARWCHLLDLDFRPVITAACDVIEPAREWFRTAVPGINLVTDDYRRLLDDRHWPPTIHMETVCSYFPAPFVALRTLKGEIMAGLQPGQAQALQAEDPTWLINGKRGVIQLVG